MNPVTVNGYMCPRCDELHDFYVDAVDCCQDSPPNETRYRCSECLTLHEDMADAEACCVPEDDGNLIIPEYLRRIPRQQLEDYGQRRLL